MGKRKQLDKIGKKEGDGLVVNLVVVVIVLAAISGVFILINNQLLTNQYVYIFSTSMNLTLIQQATICGTFLANTSTLYFHPPNILSIPGVGCGATFSCNDGFIHTVYIYANPSFICD